MKFINITFLLFLICLTSSCEKDQTTSVNENCDEAVLIDPAAFENAFVNPLNLRSIFLIDDCLHVEYWGSGNDGETWTLNLIDSGEVFDSAIPMRRLRFSFTDNEPGRAIIEKTAIFDLSHLKISDNSLHLTISNLLAGPSAKREIRKYSLQYKY